MEIVFLEWPLILKLIGITIEQYFMDHNPKRKHIRFLVEESSIYRSDYFWWGV